MGAFWVDLDGDGRLDLYLTNVGPNAVYWNRGDGTFEEGRDTGLEDPLFSVGAGFLDYDGDGRLDVVVANYLDSTPEWEAEQPQFELRVPEDYVGQPSHLYRNDGDRHFTRRDEGGGTRHEARATRRRSASPCSTTTATAGPISTSSTTAHRTGSFTTRATEPSRR